MYQDRSVIHMECACEKATGPLPRRSADQSGQVRTGLGDGWFGKELLPDDEEPAAIFEQKSHEDNPTKDTTMG